MLIFSNDDLFLCSVLFSWQADIVGVNEIFRDLATMVHEQGDMIGEKVSRIFFCS